MNIYLIGFMGSGKSTIGKILSEKLNMKFVDLDKEIEKQEKMSIPEIFKEKGEKYFRNIEKNILEKMSKKSNLIVSTGGGVGADIDNLEKMKKTGTVIWLDVSLDEVFKRCEKDEKRPLLDQPYYKIKKLYNERKNIYSKADITVKVDNKSPDEISNEIMGKLKWKYTQE